MNGKVFVGQKALSLTEYEKKAPHQRRYPLGGR